MLNRKRTLEVLGYDFDPDKRRRTKEQIEAQPDVVRKSELLVIDNCPSCNIERIIKYRQSKKNKFCSKCFHNQDYVIDAKRNQTKVVSETARQRMRENHWSKNGGISTFKGKQHTMNSKK